MSKENLPKGNKKDLDNPEKLYHFYERKTSHLKFSSFESRKSYKIDIHCTQTHIRKGGEIGFDT